MGEHRLCGGLVGKVEVLVEEIVDIGVVIGLLDHVQSEGVAALEILVPGIVAYPSDVNVVIQSPSVAGNEVALALDGEIEYGHTFCVGGDSLPIIGARGAFERLVGGELHDFEYLPNLLRGCN